MTKQIYPQVTPEKPSQIIKAQPKKIRYFFKRITLFSAIMLIFVKLNLAFLHASLYEAIPYLKNFYLANFIEDTAALNSVTAIYLDYRVFDSIFEAGILLVAVTGILFIAGSDKGDDYETF